MKPTVLLVLSLLVPGCASSMIASHIRSQGEVVNEYERDGHTYYVVRTGSIVRKWDQVPGGSASVLYEVDTVTETCKTTDNVIPCDKLKKDADMAPFITW